MRRSDNIEIDVVIGKHTLRLTSQDVIRKLRGVKPGRIKTHAVDVEGVFHPVKEAFAAVTGVDVLDFNTNTARAAFKRLGFDVVRIARE
jgi:hypothetical protein